MGYESGRVIDRPVGLEDVLPTILNAIGIDVPTLVEGSSLTELLPNDRRTDQRSTYHGEHGPCYDSETGTQVLVDETTKYI